jgi:predicted membrane channel-forming protein YqfA (hemolysin III family)
MQTFQILKPFDYGSCVFGITGTLLLLGVFGQPPRPVIVIWGFFSTFVCLVSLGPLVVNLFIHYLKRSELLIYLLHASCNLVPTLYLLSHLKETPWEIFFF